MNDKGVCRTAPAVSVKKTKEAQIINEYSKLRQNLVLNEITWMFVRKVYKDLQCFCQQQKNPYGRVTTNQETFLASRKYTKKVLHYPEQKVNLETFFKHQNTVS